MYLYTGGGTATTVEAELGGLLVKDLTPDCAHSHVFAFGTMVTDLLSHLDQTLPAHMYQVISAVVDGEYASSI